MSNNSNNNGGTANNGGVWNWTVVPNTFTVMPNYVYNPFVPAAVQPAQCATSEKKKDKDGSSLENILPLRL